MMDTRYYDRGYSAVFNEEPYGAFVTLYKNNKVIKEISIGFMDNSGKISVRTKNLEEDSNDIRTNWA